ncbi:MAG TPA: hypothetical protein PK668_08575 [Myxococcota bacterium]|nr:hypothetical protein [Myxococcota bacterium]HRY92968.1 hypothetical protein [Myxococcota bacterium]HSA22073.1 hypothetical protein [Myxococcota bacterium]
MSTWRLLLLALIATLAPGCTAKTYTLLPGEARRAASQLARGESAVVEAQDRKGRAVRIEVRADDQLEAIPAARVGRANSSTSVEASRLDLLDLEAVELELHPHNPGAPLLAIGVPLMLVGWGAGVAGAAAGEHGTWAIPIAGPLVMMADLLDCDSEHDSNCGLFAISSVLAFFDFAVQAVGTGMILGGALRWEGSREIEVKGADGETAFSFTLEPAVMGEGGAGGFITGRF